MKYEHPQARTASHEAMDLITTLLGLFAVIMVMIFSFQVWTYMTTGRAPDYVLDQCKEIMRFELRELINRRL